MIFRSFTRKKCLLLEEKAVQFPPCLLNVACSLNYFSTIFHLGMARGIPRPSILEVPDLFSLLDSPRNRFYNSSAPRILAKIRRGPRNTEYRTIFSNLSRFFCFPFCFFPETQRVEFRPPNFLFFFSFLHP